MRISLQNSQRVRRERHEAAVTREENYTFVGRMPISFLK
jgi:hypothetical protein